MAEQDNHNQPEKSAPEKIVPRVRALRRTDKALDKMTSADAMQELAEEAAEDWRQHAPPRFRNLLDATS